MSHIKDVRKTFCGQVKVPDYFRCKVLYSFIELLLFFIVDRCLHGFRILDLVVCNLKLIVKDIG